MSDREKPSWRELDRRRDRSAHARAPAEAGGGSGAPRVATATAQYKRQLDALFERGEVPTSLQARLDALPAAADALAGAPSASKVRVQLVRAVRTAASGPALVKALDALLATPEGLPDDAELLLRALEHPSDAALGQALAPLEAQVAEGRLPPKPARFVERLKGVALSSFDPRIQARAAALAAALAGKAR